MDPSSALTAAAAAYARGNLNECAALCRQALATAPSFIQAKLMLGIVAAKTGDPEGAINLLTQVAQADPTSFQAPFWLSVAHRATGNIANAIGAAETAVAIHPDDPQGAAQLGICYLDARLLPEALRCLRSAAAAAPHVLDIQCSLARCLYLQGRQVEARAAVVCALDRIQTTEEQLLKVGSLLLGQEFALGAVEFARRAVSSSPDSAQAHVLLGRALTEHDGAEAVEQLRTAVTLDPANWESKAALGAALQAVGEIQEASSLFQDSLQVEPNQGYAHFGLFHNRKVREDDRPQILAMHDLAAEGMLAPRQLSYLHYGLGKAHEDLGEYAEAMGEYDEANRIGHMLKFRGRSFDRRANAAKVDRVITVFDRHALTANSAVGSDSDLPIFVVGMMRSGTTLAEQILSSHPDVGPGGEQSFWPDNWREAMDENGAQVSPEGLRRVADRYLALLQELVPGKRSVVDKLPGNAFGLGIIHLALPNARIIHMRRHPVDTCLSIYATPNRAHVEFAHNRENIVFNYRQYLRVMEHWRMVLPPGAMLEVDYEDLVVDTERITRQMIEFCGLGWDDACLSPQNNARQVITPSVWQVRQPIYKTSANRWRNFEPYLGPFRELL
ncbi:MAG: tetratricopeptide repeat-containing sulfotransferase family protein [Fimbriimonadaceae bacterium]